MDIDLPKDMHKSVHSGIIYNCPKLETTTMSLNGRMNIKIVLYSSSEVPYNSKKEQTTTVNHMDESRKHKVAWQKPNLKKYVL